MRFLLGLSVLLIMGSSFAAGNVEGPKSYSEQLDKSDIEFLRQLAKNIEDAGYNRVQIIPEMFVVLATREGKRIVLIVNSNTLKAAEIEGGIEALTAGTNELAPPETSLPKLH